MIDLAIGHPSSHLLASKELAVATRTVYDALCSESSDFDAEDRHPLQYGTDAGPLSFRKTVAQWFQRKYDLAEEIDPALLCVTCGASAGLGNTCLQMTDPQYTRRIFMITPAYFLAAKVFQDAGYRDKMFAIDELDDGFDVEQLHRILEDDEQMQNWPQEALLSGKRYKYLFYAVPTFSNPSGIVWSRESRLSLLKLARKYDILIITDEVYDFLNYRYDFATATPAPRLVDLDIQTLPDSSQASASWGNTISNMSFSKYIGPGLRIGTIQCATTNLADQWSSGGANHSGGAMAQHTSYYVTEMIKNGALDAILSNLQRVYADRSLAMLNALTRYLPKDCNIRGGTGGYFIWLELPKKTRCTSDDILEFAQRKYGVRALSGRACEVPGANNQRSWSEHCIRLSLSKLEKKDAIEGIRLLGLAIEELGGAS